MGVCSMVTHYQTQTDGCKLVGNKIHLSHCMLEIGNNGCGPYSVEELVHDMQLAMKEAKESLQCVLLNYAGLKDLLVFPNGAFVIIDTGHLIHYKLVETS